MKKEDMKNLLRQQELPVYGNKSALIARLTAALSMKQSLGDK
jgi:hypothetical protein